MLAIAGLALAASPATAATPIVSENWQNPVDDSDGLRLDDTSNFTGWEFTQGGANIFVQRHHGDQWMPQAGLSPNIGVQFEWAGEYAAYDTTHNWSSADEYQVTLNATEMNWSNGNDRTVAIRIREVVPGAETFGTILWSDTALLPEYDADHAGAGDLWNANQQFTFNFNAADFTGGTEGTALSFEVGSEGNRGLTVDDIEFSLIPEPTSSALIGLGVFALLFRRRK